MHILHNTGSLERSARQGHPGGIGDACKASLEVPAEPQFGSGKEEQPRANLLVKNVIPAQFGDDFNPFLLTQTLNTSNRLNAIMIGDCYHSKSFLYNIIEELLG